MLQVFGPDVGADEVAAVAECLAQSWMGLGPKVSEFESEMARRVGRPFLMVNSGSNALHLAVRLLELPAGSKVIVPAFTWVACANAVALEGLEPVLADVSLETGNITAECICDAMVQNVRAIMVVHYAGLPVDMKGLRSWGLPLIEDAAHAIDSARDGVPCGAEGDVAIFSFDPVKNVATPDAGGIAADAERIARGRGLRYCGLDGAGHAKAGSAACWWESEQQAVFPRYVPNDVAAAIGLVQLRKLPDLQRRRREVWRAYQEELGDVGWLALPREPSSSERHSFFTYLVRVLDGRRDALARHLREHGVYTTLRFPPLDRRTCFRSARRLPNCEILNEEALNLPLHPRMTDCDVDRVIALIRAF